MKMATKLGFVACALLLADCGGNDEVAAPVTNQPPVVALAGTPSSGTTGTPITLAATASDPDDSVSMVELFDGATKLGEDSSSPYTLA